MPDNAPPLILLTRPMVQSQRFACALHDRLPDAEIVIAPLMEVVPIAPPPEASTARTLIFTSENAIPQAGPGKGRVAWCVGGRTAAAARAAGFDATSVEGTADDLVAHLSGMQLQGPVWHLHGVHVRGDVGGRLTRAGTKVNDAAVYDQRAVAPSATFHAALTHGHVIAPVFSPRSARLLAKAAGHGARLTPVAISAAARDALPPAWQSGTELAESPDAAAMLAAIARRIGT